MTNPWNPNIDWSLENFTLVREYEKVSATWSFVWKKSTLRMQPWIRFMMKCICSWMCFLCWCWTRYLVNSGALWFSCYRVVIFYCYNPNYGRILWSDRDSLLSLTIPWYYASIKERSRDCCFLQAQVTSPEPRLKT